LLKNPSRQPTGRNRSDRFGKLVRLVFSWTVGKNTARGKNSKFQAIISQFVPRNKVRLWGSLGHLMGYLWLEARSPKPTQSRGIGSQPSRTPTMETTKNTPILEGLLDQDHQAKRHKVLVRDIQQESFNETPPKRFHRNPKKRPRNSPKRKNGSNTFKLYISKRFILSVRNVVPTLTSSKRRGLSLNGRC
jgi:hypothetical protein